MIYALKFGASFILPPGIFLFIFFWLSCRLWRRGERTGAAVLAAAAFALYLLSMPLVSSELMRGLESAYAPPGEPKGDVIVMLGGGATQDTPDIDGEGELAGSPANRLLTAARLYRRLHVPILLSGGQVYEETGAEAKIARRILIGLGVPEKDILVETESLTTGQNAKNSAAILEARGLSSPILVTSAFHMKRSVLNFEKQGLKVVPYPADYRVNVHTRAFHYMWLSPQADALADSVCVMREELRYLVTATLGF